MCMCACVSVYVLYACILIIFFAINHRINLFRWGPQPVARAGCGAGSGCANGIRLQGAMEKMMKQTIGP